MENCLSLNELCKRISISVATGKNWIKLNKISPDIISDGNYYFSLQNVEKIESELKSGSAKILKSRRNKRFITGHFLYKDYISAHSSNIESVQQLLNTIEKLNISLADEIIQLFIAEAALQFFYQTNKNIISSNLLLDYLQTDKCKCINDIAPFLSQFYKSTENAISFLETYPELFKIQYFYESKEDVLGLIYLSCKNIGNRKATGSYYTPTKVVNKLISNLSVKNKLSDKTKICDPCCGTGNFLLQLPDFFQINNIYGFDLDEIAIKITRINIALKYNNFNFVDISSRIKTDDFLLSNDTDLHFDYIIGNPPWGYNFDESVTPRLRDRYASTELKNIESYDLFIERALQICNLNGYVSFILPEAILNVKSHKAIRNIILHNSSISYIEYLGNAFDKVNCPCIILKLEHTNQRFCCTNLSIKTKEKQYIINNNRPVTADCFSFLSTDEEYNILAKIDSVPNKATLFNHADFALGIVTGDNEKYISNSKTKENEIILKGLDIYKYKFSEPNNFITFRPENFQQVAPIKFYRADEKLLYRFISNQLVFAYDDRKTLSLNSCNILIPHIEDLNIKYIMAILNSRIAQFYFKKNFNSIKILRSHIEQIPIPKVDMEIQSKIISLVELLLDEHNQDKILEFYNKIDKEICNIFNLSDAEFSIIEMNLNNENLFLF